MNSLLKYGTIGLALIISMASCRKDDTPQDNPVYPDIPAGFTTPDIPADNQFTEKRIELGKMLFFDKTLSRDSTIACASCHLNNLAFSDDKPLSVGIYGQFGLRNAPPLFNLAWHNKFFKDGGVPTLELQVLAPLEDPREMGMTTAEVVDRIKVNPLYIDLARVAYDREPDAFVLTRAIACYERTLISGNSRYDQYEYQGNTSALTEQEIRGMNLFESLNCRNCHSGFNFTDYSFRNNGLYEVYADSGRTRITLDPADRGKFKVASLRNVALTAPYMHDGSLQTLEEVIDHYNSGGSNHPNKDTSIVPLHLTNQNKQDLVAFLNSLTDESFVSNQSFLP